MKGQIFLVLVVFASILFISPYVSSFSLDEINYDLSNVVGYLVYDFRLITGMAGTSCDAPAFCDPTCSQANQQPASGTCIAPDICCEEISYCGDGNVDAGEECDSGENNGEVCTPSPGLSCSYCDSNCQLASVEGSSCGDGTCDADETCSSCPSDCEGVTGAPACASNQICEVILGSGTCSVVEAPSACGNNVIDGTEVCDGSDLNSKTCVTQGFLSGSLSCNSDCLSFDTSGCSNAVEEETTNDDEDSIIVSNPVTCVDVNGVCSDECANGFVHYGDINFDRKCEMSYGTGLICCVPSYSVPGEESSSTNEESEGISGSVRSVEDYVIDEENIQTSPINPDVQKGFQGILLSPSYAMGGVWVVFGLTILVVGISFYVHGRIYRKK